jgi:HEAT repeat protein
MAESKPNVAELVNRLPDPDKPDRPSTFTGPGPELAEKIFDEILAGGRQSLLELIGSIRDPSDPDFKNYKADYLLHDLAVYVGGAGKENQRRLLAETVASELANEQHSKAVRAALVRRLQVVAGNEAVAALGKLLKDEDLCECAAQALVAIRQGAGPQLRRALPSAKGKCRLTIVQNLGVVRGRRAVEALREAIKDENREVRLAAGWALANLGDAGSVDVVLKAADVEPGYERIAATKACLLLAERLLAAGNRADAKKVYSHLRQTRSDKSDRYVREAAEKALAEIG